MEKALTEEQLRSGYLPYWQTILGIQDWTIRVQVKRKKDMPRDHKELAHCRTWRGPKEALVTIRDHEDDDPFEDYIFERDMEDDLIHELMHVVFRECFGHDSPGGLKEEEERMTYLMTRAFVVLSRKDFERLKNRNAEFTAAMEEAAHGRPWSQTQEKGECNNSETFG